MHTIQIDIDDKIFDKFMGLIDLLPKDKLEVTGTKNNPDITFAESRKDINTVSSLENQINQLLVENNLLHFKFYKDPDRILYASKSESPTHIEDFNRLIRILKRNKIKHTDIGVDIIMLGEDI
ncbi:MAG: hypothetical protein U9Q40_01170 [Campylobacterota bacterium]|nr:hypothetical protein [Campylobacterota bacterium]